MRVFLGLTGASRFEPVHSGLEKMDCSFKQVHGVKCGYFGGSSFSFGDLCSEAKFPS